MSRCHPTMDLWTLFGVVLSMVAVAQSMDAIGANPLVCITFELPRWDGKFKDSRGNYLDINGVTKPSCTLTDKCGLFGDSSSVKIPFFNGNSFFKLSISVWVKRNAGNPSNEMAILNAAKCFQTPFVLVSSSEHHIRLFVKTSTGMTYHLQAQTPSQISDFVHVVFTFSASVVDESGQARLYINGNLAAEKLTQGKFLPLPGPIILGSDPDCPPKFDYKGLLDSVSFARTELSASDVMKLYNSPGSCIGI